MTCYDGSAGSMDPASIRHVVRKMLEWGIDVIELTHDNDAKGIVAAKAGQEKIS